MFTNARLFTKKSLLTPGLTVIVVPAIGVVVMDVVVLVVVIVAVKFLTMFLCLPYFRYYKPPLH